MKSLKRKFMFGTKVLEQLTSNVATGWQYLFSDLNGSCEHDSFLHHLNEQNLDEDSNCEFDYGLKDLFLLKEELYFERQLVYPSIFENHKTSVSNKNLFNQNNIQNGELIFPKGSNIKSIEDIKAGVTAENQNFASNMYQNASYNPSENNSSFTHSCYDIIDNSKLSPGVNLNSAPRKNDIFCFKDNIHFFTDKDAAFLEKDGKILEFVQKLTNNQISSGIVSLEYKDALKSQSNSNLFDDFKMFLDSKEVRNSSLNMPMYFKENMGVLQHICERNPHVLEDNITSCHIISPINLNKHVNEISEQSYTLKCKILNFLQVISDFVKMIYAKINSVDLFTFENQIFFLLLRKKLTSFIAYILRYISSQEQENLLFLLSSLISKITFPKLDVCAYHSSKNCIYFPKHLELNNSFNLNKHRKVTERFDPDLFAFDWSMPSSKTSMLLNNKNKQSILHEAENLDSDIFSDTNNQLCLTYNSKSNEKNAEISIVDNASQINTNCYLTENLPTKFLNAVYNKTKFNKKIFETDFVKRVPKKRKKISTHNNLKKMSLIKHDEIKSCEFENKYEILNDTLLDLEKTENVAHNSFNEDINCKINICVEKNLEEISEDTVGDHMENSSQAYSKFDKSLKRNCFDCVVILKDFNCKESELNEKVKNDSHCVKVLTTVSKEKNISLENRGRKRKNNSLSTGKVLNKKVKSEDKKQKNIALGDQRFSGNRRRSCRLLSKIKSCPSFSALNSTSSENNFKAVEKDYVCSKFGEDATFSTNFSETCNSIIMNEEMSSLEPENVSFVTNYPTTKNFHSELFIDESDETYSEKSISKIENKVNKQRTHQSGIEKNSLKHKFKTGMDYTQENGKNNVKRKKLEEKHSDEKKNVAITRKIPSIISTLTTQKTEKTALINSQLKTKCNCIAKSVRKCRCLKNETREKIACAYNKNRNSRKQKVSQTQNSNPFIISSSQSNTFYTSDGNSFFQISKTIQGTYKNPSPKIKKTNINFGDQERFIRKRGQTEYSRSIFENKLLDTANDSLDNLELMHFSQFHHFQNSNSGNKNCKRKRNSSKKILKCPRTSDSKAVVKFSPDQLLPYPKFIDDRMYFVQSGKVNVATLDDLRLKPTKLNSLQKHESKRKSIKTCKEY